MLISDLLVYIRDGLGTSSNARWTDAEILRVAQIAVVRAQGILQRNDIYFGRSKVDFTTTATVNAYDVPGDFAAVVGLWRTDQHKPLTHKRQQDWENIISASEASCFAIDGEDLLIAGTPTTAIPMRLRYWPVAPTLSLAGSTPWMGRLDFVLIPYVQVRLFNADEMTVQQDVELLQDLENNIISQFAQADPAVETHRGWMVNG